MLGGGLPSALQLRVAGSPLETIKSEGSSAIRGAPSSNRALDPVEWRGGQTLTRHLTTDKSRKHYDFVNVSSMKGLLDKDTGCVLDKRVCGEASNQE